jgi:hypothetical protein
MKPGGYYEITRPGQQDVAENIHPKGANFGKAACHEKCIQKNRVVSALLSTTYERRFFAETVVDKRKKRYIIACFGEDDRPACTGRSWYLGKERHRSP